MLLFHFEREICQYLSHISASISVCHSSFAFLLKPSLSSPAGPSLSQASGFMNALTKFILAKTESEGADSGDMLAEARDSGNAEGELHMHLLLLRVVAYFGRI